MNRLQAEANRAKQDLDMLQAKYGQLLKQVDDNRDQAARLEASLAEGKLKLADMTLDKANLQSEINQKDAKIRLLLARKTKTITQNSS